MYLPNVPKFHDDELLYSYLRRVAKANGFLKYRNFYELFISESRYDTSDVKYDCTIDMTMFFSLFDRDEIELYINHSIYGGLSFLLYDFQQMFYINKVFGSNKNHVSLSSSPQSMIKEIHLCPECIKEELEKYGYYWIHMSHQIPNVTVCHKHKIALKKYVGKLGLELNLSLNDLLDTDYVVDLNVNDLVSEYNYSLFVNKLFDYKIDGDLQDIKQIIKRKVDEIDSSDFIENLQRKNKFYYYSSKLDRYLTKKNVRKHKNRIKNEDILSLLYILFEHPEEILFVLSCVQKENTDFFSYLNLSDYELVDKFDRKAIKLKHLTCGSQYVTTPYGFMHGWSCPNCKSKLSDADYFQEIFQIHDKNDEYILLDKYSSSTKPIKIHHKTCDRDFMMTPYSFIHLGSRCACFQANDLKDNKPRIKYLEENGYEILKYGSRRKKSSLKHLVCNTIFDVDYKYILNETVKCPKCRLIDDRNKQKNNFIGKMYDLVGDEYTLVSDYQSKNDLLTIRHNLCGKNSQYYSWRFLEGFRCPYCSVILRYDLIKDAVNTISNGIYVIEKQADLKGYYHIKNTLTGESKIMYGWFIIQELTRVTPSKILPLENKQSYDFRNNKFSIVDDKIKMWLLNHSDLSMFTMQDIVDDIHIPLYSLRRKLCNIISDYNFYVVNLKKNYYVNNNYDFELFIRDFFVDDGNKIGYYTCDSFLYEIGYLSSSPSVVTLKSNKIATQYHIKNKKEIIGKHSSFCIDNKNVYIVALLDFLNENENDLLYIDAMFMKVLNRYIVDHNIVVDLSKKYQNNFRKGYKILNQLFY